jgi:hypothetical protein
MNILSCRECRKCNRKGKPSVMRGSKYCDDHRIAKANKKIGFFTDFKNRLYDKRSRYDKEGKLKEVKYKGFRESWFWR